MKKSLFKVLKGNTIAIASSAIIAAATMSVVQTSSNVTSTTKSASATNDATYTYEPITIASGYNCNTIATTGETDFSATTPTSTSVVGINAVDDPAIETNQTKYKSSSYNNACLYTNCAAKAAKQSSYIGLPDPDSDGYTYITSEDENTPNLTWKIPVSTSKSVDNTMKLFGIGKTTATNKFTFDDFGVYNKLYILCIAAQTTDSTQTITFDAQINYVDGKNPTTDSYTVYDWFPSSDNLTKLKNAGLFANDNFERFYYFQSGGFKKEWTSGSKQGEVVFNQCPITVDTTRVVESLQITLTGGTDTSTLAVFGVTGAIAGDVLAPVSIKTHSAGTTTSTVTWADASTESASNTKYYYLDVYHEESGKTVWDIQARELDAETYKSTHTYTIAADDSGNPLVEGTKYHVRMRAGNENHVQSANSNTDYIVIDSVVPTEVYFYVKDGQTEKTQFTIGVGKPQTVYTQVRNKESKAKLKDQDISKWTIPDTLKDKIKIKQKTQATDDDDPSWEFTSSVPTDSAVVTATAHAEETITSNDLTATVDPNAPTWAATTGLGAKKATLNWTQPEIGDTTAANNTYVLTVTDPDGGVIVDEETLSYATTSKSLTGLSSQTTYTATIKTVCNYGGTEYTSDEVTTTFTTEECTGSSITISGTSTLNYLWKGKDATASQTATTIVNSSSEGAATTQDLKWDDSAATNNGEVSETHTFTKDTNGVWTITAEAPGKVVVSLSSETYTSITAKTLTINIVPVATTAKEASNPTPKSFVANWNAVDWAEGYRVSLYLGDATTPFVQKEVDATETSFKFEDCDDYPITYNTTYKYTVEVICKDKNGDNVYSSATSKESITTPTSMPTGITAKIDGVEIPGDEYTTLVGNEVTITTEVAGQEFEGEEFLASDQKVLTNKGSETNLNVVETSGGGSTHTYQVTGELTGKTKTVFDLYANADNTVTKSITVNVAQLQGLGSSNITANSFDISWSPIDSTLIETPANFSYVIEYTTDPNWATYDTVSAASTETSITVSDVSSSTKYYVRARYKNNGYYSITTPVQELTTQDGIKSFGLDKDLMTIVGTGSEDTDTLTATLVSSGADAEIEWEVENEEIASIVNQTTTDANGEVKVTKVVKPHAVGTTYINAWPKGHQDEFKATCKLDVVKAILDPLVLQVKDVTTESFTLYWNSITDWNGGSVKYKVSVWWEGEEGFKSYILKNYVTGATQKKINKKNSNIVNGVTYHCTVHAFNDHFETNEANEVQVRLLDYGMPLWEIIAISTTGGVAFLLLLALALYILWKKSILKTYDIDNVKYTKSGKPKTHDKFFRAMDKVIVTANQKTMKRSNSLFTRFGTKEEQQRSNRKNYNRKK